MRRFPGVAVAAVLALVLWAGLAGCSGGSGCGGSAPSFSGELKLFFGPVVFDSVAADLTHRRDVDAGEDGVIVAARIELSIGGYCAVSLTAQGCPDADDRLPIVSARVEADAHCPGLGQGMEGVYVSAGSGALGFVDLGLAVVPDRDAESSCFASAMTIQLGGKLIATATGAEVTVSTSSASVSGDFVSAGDYTVSSECSAVIGGGDARGETTGDPDVTTGDAEVAQDVPLGPPCMAKLAVACPECDSAALVRVSAAKGWVVDQAEYTHVFDAPVLFPVEAQIEEAMDPTGKMVRLPEGTVTFLAWQDTVAGGMAPEEGEPVSKLVTVDLAAGQITKVSLLLDPDAEPVVTCTPGAYACLSSKVSGHCNETGDAWEKTDCFGSAACNEDSGTCMPIVCTPSAVECLDAHDMQQCLPSGTGWMASGSCSDEFVCLNGNCINQACIAEVVLLVDTSQSMGKNWEAVSTSIQKLAAMSPNASFAMVSFPSAKATGCGVPTGASVPMGSNQAGTFFEWFADNNPFGLTPLAEMMTGMSGLAPALFSAGSGTLILLSDGADTCAYKTMTDIEEREKLLLADLEAATTALFTGQGVKTYVIGYNFEGNPAELDAVAKSGGTGKTTYTPAGSEQELTTALIGIAQDIKLCFEQ